MGNTVLSLDLQHADRTPLAGAVVTVSYDREVRLSSGGTIPPLNSGNPVVVQAGTPPTVTVVQNDDPTVASSDQGFAVIVETRWTDPATLRPQYQRRTVSIGSAQGASVALSALADTQAVPAALVTVTPAQINKASTDASNALATANDAESKASAAVASQDSATAQNINTGTNTQAAGDKRWDAGDPLIVHVTANGNDANSGRTQSAGKATITAALTAMGTNPGVIVLGVGTIPGNVAWPANAKCGMVGQGPANTTIAGTVNLSAVGYNLQKSEFGGFTIDGQGSTNAGLTLSSSVSLTFAKIHDITVKNTGGPCFDLGMSELCYFDRLTATEPVNAAANDVPYVKATGAFNGNHITSLTLFGTSAGANVGPSGAVIVAGTSTTTPHDNHIDSPRVEALHLSSGATLFAFAANGCVVSDLQMFDTNKVAGAAGTSHMRFTTPTTTDLGGNLVRGVIPGKGSGANDLDMGIDMRQARNSVSGVKGFRGTNVIIAASIGYTDVDLKGAVSAATDPAVIDNSGMTTNRFSDSYLNVLRGNGTGARLIVSGAYYGPGNHTPGTVAATVGVNYAIPVWLPASLTVTSIECQVTAAATSGSGGVVRLGAYAPANNTDYPGALLFDAGTVSTETTGVKAIAGSWTLPAGLVWLTACEQVATASFTSVGSGSLSPVVGGAFTSGMNSYYAQNVTGALPATFSLYAPFTGGIKVMVKAK